MLLPVAAILQLVDRSDLYVHNSGMLNDLRIRVQKLHANTAYIRELRLLRQIRQPVRPRNFDIIVQKEQKLSVCLRCTQIAHRREIKLHRLIKKPCTPGFVVLLEKLFYPLLVLRRASVIYHNDLIGRIVRIFLNGVNASSQNFRIVLAGNNDADQSLFCGFAGIPSCQRILDQIAVPGFSLPVGMEQNLRNVPDRETIVLSSCKTAVCLCDLQAELVINPGTHAVVQIVLSGIGFFPGILFCLGL